MNLLSLALDIHGVLDRSPETFVKLAWSVRYMGGKVHILTGASISEGKIIDKLMGIYSHPEFWWDELVSIQDELVKSNAPVIGVNEFGRPMFPNDLWNGFKGRYCASHKIDLAIDDSPEYIPYFTTPVLLYPR